MYRAESEFSKRETRNRLLGADIATDQTKTFNTDNSPRKSSEAATEEVFTIKSITIQTKRQNSSSATKCVPRSQNGAKHPLIPGPNIRLNMEPNG
jgi:hypothetical protein